MRHVIGFGNPLHGDDGAAAAVCADLAAAPLAADVRVFDAGTRGLDALALLETCDEAILIDAAWPAGTPGRIDEPDTAAVLAEAGLSGHGSGLGFLLRALAAVAVTPPQLRLITIEAAGHVQFSPGLSAPVAAAVRQVAIDLRRELARSWDRP